MSVLQVVKDAAGVIGISVPTAVIAATDDTSVAIKGTLNEVAQMIAFDSDHDWSALKTLATITGDGATELWDLPADYRRMLKKAKLWPSWLRGTPLTHYADTDSWLAMQTMAFTPIIGGWTLAGGQIDILPVVPSGATVKYYYLTANIAKSASGAPKAAFTADDDTFPIFPGPQGVAVGERLLKLGFIYRWKQDRGQDYGEAMEDFQTALASAIGADKGSNILVLGQPRVPSQSNVAYPATLGT